MSKPDKKIVIIGNGISGITCARNIRKGDDLAEILVISGETDHFFSRTALMYIYMGHMRYEHTKPYEDWFWDKNRINLLKAWIEIVDFDNKLLFCHDGNKINYDILILATGSRPNKLGLTGQELHGVQGLYSIQDLELMEENTQDIQKAVVVGGGLIGIEMAEMLASRKIPVTFLVREKNFWDNVLPLEEAELVNRHIREHHIDLRLETELEEIIGDEENRVKGIRTNKGETINCEFVGLTVGVSPNISFLRDTKLDTNRGILVDQYFKTNISDVYAIGDCAEFKEIPGPGRKNIEQVWYTGRMHGETLAHNLTSSNPKPYRPGIWFNSAKFFDIEYQTYGWVPPVWDSKFSCFYWEDSYGKVCLRLIYESETGKITGVNAFGMRLRHEFFDQVISEGWKFEKVLENLEQANFNPEFYKPYFKDVLEKYNKETGRNILFKKVPFFKRLTGMRT
ncbi:NAD(P)/FAD-dependent oxidoreductase [Shivajiella indica]|uniref:NAD(P)/FAD-dependent oxidoreductase n=1 Tax=Shivajiella indica TaxID=872115 RepID=A0ABW5BAU9_9BACT